jgi:hypothetical protein
VKKVGLFNRFSNIVWRWFEPGIIYPDGTTTPPPAVYSEDFDCPFNENEAETFDQGVLLAYIICFNLCVVTVAMTGFIWKRYWNKEVKEIKGHHLATLNDMIIMAGVFIDFCQYLSFGPKFESLNSAIWDLSKGLSIDLSGLIEMS